MTPLSVIENYLCDQNDGIQGLITWFLNLVMLLEAERQAGATVYNRTETRTCHRNGSSPGVVRLHSRNTYDAVSATGSTDENTLLVVA